MDFRRLTYAPAHTLYSMQAAHVLHDLRLYVLFMLKPRHARYRTFRTEEQQQLHTHTSLFHNRGFTTRGFTIGGSLHRLHHSGHHHKVSPQGRSPQGVHHRGVQHKVSPRGGGGLFRLVWVKFHLNPTS